MQSIITDNISKASRIIIAGQRVSFEKTPQYWVATGWQQGLPVARRPITTDALVSILGRFDSEAVWYV